MGFNIELLFQMLYENLKEEGIDPRERMRVLSKIVEEAEQYAYDCNQIKVKHNWR